MSNTVQYGTIYEPRIERPANLSRDEMDARAEATRHSREMARIEAARAKEDDLLRRIAKSTEVSIANNVDLRWGGGAITAQIGGRSDHAGDVNVVGPGGITGTYYHAQADRVPVKVGGVELSPEQAKAWVADGSITPKQYSDAVTEAMQRYQPGYRHSFR